MEIKIIQMGMGPLGLKIADFIAERKGLKTVAAVDKSPALIGKKIAGVIVRERLEEALLDSGADVVVLTTVSDLERVTPQLEEILSFGLPVVSTCEELSYPWEGSPQLTARIDDLARAKGVGVLGTGVNPGFLMDALPVFLTAVCQKVRRVEVRRYQDAQYRRLPFQRKIGAGLSLDAFEKKKRAGTLRHVGLTELMQFIAHHMGWTLERTEDLLEPVIALEEIHTSGMAIPKGYASGVRQVGNAYVDGEIVIRLVFQAAVGEKASYDEILIDGEPNIHSRIEGGINGDIATCAITVNAIRPLLKAEPGLRTMGDVPLVSYFSS